MSNVSACGCRNCFIFLRLIYVDFGFSLTKEEIILNMRMFTTCDFSFHRAALLLHPF